MKLFGRFFAFDMFIKLKSGTLWEVHPAEHIVFPLNKQFGESFDLVKDEWETDRAWTAQQHKHVLNPVTKKVDEVLL